MGGAKRKLFRQFSSGFFDQWMVPSLIARRVEARKLEREPRRQQAHEADVHIVLEQSESPGGSAVFKGPKGEPLGKLRRTRPKYISGD